MDNSVFNLPFTSQSNAQIVVRLCIPGVNPHHLRKMSDRLIKPALFYQGNTQVVVGLRIFGIYP